jgi:hypothetical protein
MSSNSDISIQAAAVGSITEAVVNTGDRAPDAVFNAVQGAAKSAQAAQQPDGAGKQPPKKKNEKQAAVAKWKQTFSDSMLKQPEGKREAFLQAERRNLTDQLTPDLKQPNAKLNETQKRKKFEIETKLEALKAIVREFNEAHLKTNVKNGTSKKDKAHQKKVVQTVEELANNKPKSKKSQKKAARKLAAVLFDDAPPDLPLGPTGKEQPEPKAAEGTNKDRHRSTKIKNETNEADPVKPKSVSIEKPNKNKNKNDPKPKSTVNKETQAKTTKNRPNAKRVFRLYRTQDACTWRLNIFDESVRKWVYDVYTEGTSLSGGQTEPSKLAKIFTKHCNDCGYDQYLQSALPYPLTETWLKKVIHQNFSSRYTIPIIDLVSNLFIQALYLPTCKINEYDIEAENWYVDHIEDEDFMMSDDRNQIFLGNLLTCELVNEHLVATAPVAYNINRIPVKEAISDLNTITQRKMFEIVYNEIMPHLMDDYFDLSTVFNNTPANVLKMYPESFSTIELPTDNSESSDDDDDPHDGLEGCGAVEDPPRSLDSSNLPKTGTVEPNQIVINTPSTQPEICEFETNVLSSYTAFSDRLTDHTYCDDRVVVRARIMPVVLEDDVATKTRRSDESRCVFLTPTWKDKHVDNNTYAINLAHFYSIAGRLTSSSENITDSIKTALSSYSDTPYIMPHAARLTLTSPAMVSLLECVFRPLLSIAVPNYEESPALPVRPTTDHIMKLRFGNFLDKTKAYQIVPDATQSLRFIRPTRRNISLAMGKRFNNAFNYAAFVWAYPGIYGFLKKFDTINPFRVSFDHTRLFDYLQSLRIRKNLTVNEFLSYLRKAVQISDLLASDPISVARLLHYELWNNTKIFIKKELYSKDTTPRFIINPSPYVKLIYGCLIHQIEGVLYEEFSPLKNFFIKHLTEDQIAFQLKSFNDDCPPGYVFVANDFTSFEGSQPRPAQSIVFSMFFSFTDANSLERCLLNIVFNALTSYVNIHGNGFDLFKCPGQWSGLESTSCGNGSANVVNALEVMCVEPENIKAEGDDSMLRTTPDRALTLSSHSMFPCESTSASTMFDLSFCGRRLDLSGKIYVTSDEELDKYVQFNTVLADSPPSEQRLYDLGYMRLLSLNFRYPGNPIVDRCKHRFNEYYAKSGLTLSSRGVRQFARSNWWYLSEKVPALGKLINKWYAYPMKYPNLNTSDIERIKSSANPALDLSETLQFRSHKELSNGKEHYVAKCAAVVIPTFTLTLFIRSNWLKYSIVVSTIFGGAAYLTYKRLQQKWCTTNPVKYFIRSHVEGMKHAVVQLQKIDSCDAVSLKLAPLNSLPKESCLYGFNFRRSIDCVPDNKDPDLSTDQYLSNPVESLNALAASSRGQPVRVTSEQRKLLDEEYKPPDLSWLTWETDLPDIPYEVQKHSYSEFYPQRVRERLKIPIDASYMGQAPQAHVPSVPVHSRVFWLVRLVSFPRHFCGLLKYIRNYFKHRYEY